MQLCQNRISGGCPLEGLAALVVGSDEVVNALYELPDAGKRATSDRLVGDQGEESLDLIQPGAVGRDEVHVPARPGSQPRLDLRVTVGGIVVADAVDIQLGGHGLDDLAQERQELLVPVARFCTRPTRRH